MNTPDRKSLIPVSASGTASRLSTHATLRSRPEVSTSVPRSQKATSVLKKSGRSIALPPGQ